MPRLEKITEEGSMCYERDPGDELSRLRTTTAELTREYVRERARARRVDSQLELVYRAYVKALEESSEGQRSAAVARRAAGAIHDLNNLLMAISGSVAVAARRVGDHHVATPALNDIRDSVRIGATIARQLLELFRTGREEDVVIELDRALWSMLPLLQALAGDDVTVSLDLDADDRHLVARAPDIEQLLMNLVVNARDAMPTGGTIHISTCAGTANVFLSVTDCGPGIPEEYLDRIFDPLFTTKKDRGGTGLGLSVVGDTVARLGGTIRVSNTGHGARFDIVFPAAGSTPDDESHAAPTPPTALAARRS